ncbi:MAG: putative glycosyltransferase [Acidobacteria bacterium]|nr:putative glycosyltransferase [Acidobacteriota bacterium]
MPPLSVIIPVYRDADALARTLAATDFTGVDVVVSTTPDDDSLTPLRLAYPDVVWIDAPRGRARQMNAGAAAARGEWLVFLHADTQLPHEWRRAIATASEAGKTYAIGCFRFALDSASRFARLIELGVRVRVWLFRLPYGDQALFMRRELFADLGGYADLPMMEDVDLVRRARRRGRLFRSRLAAPTSARRWERDGWIRRTLRHLTLIVLYFCGVRPERLIRLDPARRAHPIPPGSRMSL